MSKNKLSQTDKETLANVTKSYTNEELDVVIKEIPDEYLWNEIMRRDSFAIEGINYIEGILDVSFDNLLKHGRRLRLVMRTCKINI